MHRRDAEGLGDLPMLLFTIFVWSKFCPVNWRYVGVYSRKKVQQHTHMKLIYVALGCCVWKMQVIWRKTIDINRQLLLQYRKPKIFKSFLAYHKWAQATRFIMLVAQLGYEEFLSSFHTPFGVSGKYFIEKCLILWLPNISRGLPGFVCWQTSWASSFFFLQYFRDAWMS